MSKINSFKSRGGIYTHEKKHADEKPRQSLTRNKSTMMESSASRDCFHATSAATSSSKSSVFSSGNAGFLLTYTKQTPHHTDCSSFCYSSGSYPGYPHSCKYKNHNNSPLHNVNVVTLWHYVRRYGENPIYTLLNLTQYRILWDSSRNHIDSHNNYFSPRTTRVLLDPFGSLGLQGWTGPGPLLEWYRNHTIRCRIFNMHS